MKECLAYPSIQKDILTEHDLLAVDLWPILPVCDRQLGSTDGTSTSITVVDSSTSELHAVSTAVNVPSVVIPAILPRHLSSHLAKASRKRPFLSPPASDRS